MTNLHMPCDLQTTLPCEEEGLVSWPGAWGDTALRALYVVVHTTVADWCDEVRVAVYWSNPKHFAGIAPISWSRLTTGCTGHIRHGIRIPSWRRRIRPKHVRKVGSTGCQFTATFVQGGKVVRQLHFRFGSRLLVRSS
jgi:hypothetical protein